MRKNQKGFGVVEGLLILVIVGLISFIGWYVWHSKNQADRSLSSASNTSATIKSTKATSPAPVDSTDNWTSYTSADGKISLKYPKTWVTASNPDLCSGGLLLLGGDIYSVGKCATGSAGQIIVTWQPSQKACSDLSTDDWAVTSKETVTVSGVKGLKQTATAKASSQPIPVALEGTPVVDYCFNTDGYTYDAQYTKQASYPDVLNDFNLMVSGTLKFSK